MLFLKRMACCEWIEILVALPASEHFDAWRARRERPTPAFFAARFSTRHFSSSVLKVTTNDLQ
jgi:hypothetical protein